MNLAIWESFVRYNLSQTYRTKWYIFKRQCMCLYIIVQCPYNVFVVPWFNIPGCRMVSVGLLLTYMGNNSIPRSLSITLAVVGPKVGQTMPTDVWSTTGTMLILKLNTLFSKFIWLWWFHITFCKWDIIFKRRVRSHCIWKIKVWIKMAKPPDPDQDLYFNDICLRSGPVSISQDFKSSRRRRRRRRQDRSEIIYTSS